VHDGFSQCHLPLKLRVVRRNAHRTVWRFGQTKRVAFLNVEDDLSELDLEDGDSLADIVDKARLMTALDTINSLYGRGTMTMASAGVEGKQKNWAMRQERMTPRYTTCIADMPIARAI
jgi:hypothetical protein